MPVTMKVIGHRGAAGLALENTIASIHAAKAAGVDAIEFDVRLTADGQLVLCHDNDTARVSKHKLNVHESTLAQLRSIKLLDGQLIPTIQEALHAIGDTPILIEAKGSTWANALAEFLDNHPPLDATVIAFNHRELGRFAKLCPAIPTYAVEHTKPFDAIQFAKQNGFTGVDMNFWILNPLTYWMARRKNLNIIVYTVNHRWIALFLNLFFPRISLTTDVPHIMQFLRPRKSRLKTLTEETSES